MGRAGPISHAAMNTPPFQQLTASEQKIVLDCMRFFRLGPDFDEVEYHAVLGIVPEELDRIIEAWPNLDDSERPSSDFLAINNCMVHSLWSWHLGQRPDEWGKWFAIPRDEVERVFRRWRELQHDPVDNGDEEG